MQAANGHEECVDALIHHGADVALRDNRGRTPLHMAAMCGHIGLFGSMIMVCTLVLSAVFFFHVCVFAKRVSCWHAKTVTYALA